MYIKAFNKDLTCNGFQYEVGETYEMQGLPILCDRGFHYCDNLNDTLPHYAASSRYCEIEPLGDVAKNIYKYCTNKIRIVREIEYDELVKLDTTGEWCYMFLFNVVDADIRALQTAVIDRDPTGEWCCRFAKSVTDADIQALQSAVIAKDPTGEWCYMFAVYVRDADIRALQTAVIAKDPTGEGCYMFAVYVRDADIQALQTAVIAKDPTGEWCYMFAYYRHGADKKLLNKIAKQRGYKQ